ncbi:MAG: sigma-70 family RNA polymerase sigma factor [Armatimonadetes bacterium]|nr:sigma-70 family RNA polymerase sigma factor [Armatimonadota bacterium]
MRTPLPSDEAELVETAAACDDRAFCALMDCHRRPLRIIVSRYADNREDRTDLEADVVATLLEDRKRALRAWRPIAPFAAYLTTIATRRCLRWLRARQRLDAQTVPLLYLPGEAKEDGFEHLAALDVQDLDELAQSRQIYEAVERALDTLPAPDRLVLQLRFEQGMNGPAIARALGIRDGAARKRIFTALRRLAAALRELSPDLFD